MTPSPGFIARLARLVRGEDPPAHHTRTTSQPAPLELVTLDDDGVREEDLPAELRVERDDDSDD